MAKSKENTGIYLIGGAFLLILLILLFKKPKSSSRYGFGGFGLTSPNVASGGGTSTPNTSTNAILCKGANDGRVGMMQRALNRAFPQKSNLQEDNKWGVNTQAALNIWFTTFNQTNAPTCLTEDEFNQVLNTY